MRGGYHSFFLSGDILFRERGRPVRGGGGGEVHFQYIVHFFFFTWSEIVGKSLPSLPHCEMREEAVGTFHPLHYLVVSTVLISEYSEPKGRKYIVSP